MHWGCYGTVLLWWEAEMAGLGILLIVKSRENEPEKSTQSFCAWVNG